MVQHPHPFPSCWHLWSSTVCTIYTGSATRTQLLQPLGEWLSTHSLTCFWHWQLCDETHLVYQYFFCSSPTQATLPTLTHHKSMKFSPMVPTTLVFSGLPITPIDLAIGQVRLPIKPVTPFPLLAPLYSCHTRLQTQFQSMLPTWQKVLLDPCRRHIWPTLSTRNFMTNSPSYLSVVPQSKTWAKQLCIGHHSQYHTPLARLGISPMPHGRHVFGTAKAFGILLL